MHRQVHRGCSQLIKVCSLSKLTNRMVPCSTCMLGSMPVKSKVLPEPHDLRLALISISLAVIQTPAYIAKPWIWHIMGCAFYSPAFTSTHCAYLQRDGLTELTWDGLPTLRWSAVPVLIYSAVCIHCFQCLDAVSWVP